MKHLRQIFAVFLLAIFCAGAAFGQAVTATLVGTITDASGAVVVNAKVTSPKPNRRQPDSNTNESGNYAFPNLPPGTYAVTAEQTGFKKATRARSRRPGGHHNARRSLPAARPDHRDRRSYRRGSRPADRPRRYRPQDRNRATGESAHRATTAASSRCSTSCPAPPARSPRTPSSSTRRAR